MTDHLLLGIALGKSDASASLAKLGATADALRKSCEARDAR